MVSPGALALLLFGGAAEKVVPLEYDFFFCTRLEVSAAISRGQFYPRTKTEENETQ